ncbi:YwdI family protein [Sporosarcina jeotgali]|uniref:YwdI family protein n=1 Tax=Sporosarcina jeotgali TaxID=3020056 RepID=A0ABZ0KW14_9BACL|nr:YwdI family protein [Sporosarcina sp. B2O-1]WOV84609.1 YwdI family protein [Sporosarcina sp. B2O-1]
MITTNRVLEEMQRQLTNAITTSDEAKMRESISAMQSLCGLILEETPQQVPSSEGKLQFLSGNSAVTAASPMELSPAKETFSTPVQTGLEGKVLDEKDANGGSLFDF